MGDCGAEGRIPAPAPGKRPDCAALMFRATLPESVADIILDRQRYLDSPRLHRRTDGTGGLGSIAIEGATALKTLRIGNPDIGGVNQGGAASRFV